jgi:hypothetical protein
MSITTWDDLKASPQSRKIGVIKIVPKELLDSVVWTNEGEFAVTIETLDSCDATTGWLTAGAATAPTLDTANKKEGTASINMGKTAGTVTATYSKTLGSTFDGTGKQYRVWVYVKDKVKLAYDSNPAIQIGIGNNAGNYYFLNIDVEDLIDIDTDGTDGWNKLGGLITSFSTVGSPNITLLDFIFVSFFTNVASTTITHGDMKMDYHRLLQLPVDKYSTPLNTFHGSDIEGVEMDGTAMNRADSESDLESRPFDEFYYDIDNEKLYINANVNLSPYDSDYVVNHLMYFTNDVGFTIDIPTDAAEIRPDPRVDKIPQIKHSNKGTVFGLSLINAASFNLNNKDSLLDEWYNDLEWSGAPCDVYLGGEDLPWSEYQIIYAGLIVRGDSKETVTWSRDELKIKIEDKRSRVMGKFALNNRDALTEGDRYTQGVDRLNVGKSAPKVYGRRVDRIPPIAQNRSYTLGADLDASATQAVLSGDITGIPDQAVAYIDSEQIGYVGISGNTLLNLTRGANDTIAAAHDAGAPITITVATSTPPGATNFSIYDPVEGIPNGTAGIKDVYFDDMVHTDANTFIDNTNNIFFRDNYNVSDQTFEDGEIITMDGANASGDDYGSMLKEILNDQGIPDSDLDTSSFTDLDSKISDSTPGVFLDWNSKMADLIELILQSAQAWFVIDSDGLISVRHLTPVVDASELTVFGQKEIQPGWSQYWDSKRLRTRIKVLFERKYALSGDKEWTVINGTNRFDDIVPVEEKELELETAEYNPLYAEELRNHLMALTLYKQERVSFSVALLEAIDLRPGDRIKVTLDRPWGNVPRVYEVEQVTINIAKGGVDIALDAHNIHGLEDKVGGWTSDSANDWSSASDDEKIQNGFWSDDDGFIDPTDSDTRNRKVWY